MNTNYYRKYIKYKTKYLNLQEIQSGGGHPYGSLSSSINDNCQHKRKYKHVLVMKTINNYT